MSSQQYVYHCPFANQASHGLFTDCSPYLLPDRIARRIPSSGSSPQVSISIDGPSSSGSGEIHHVDKSSVLNCVSSYNKRMCYAPRLQLLLTVLAGPVTIGLLPADVILNIFHFVRVIYAGPVGFPNGLTYYSGGRDLVEWRRSWWYPLIHVCGKWRSVIFASPNFLDLRLVCVPYTRVELVDIWPPFPIIIRSCHPTAEDYDFDAAIVHHDRVCEIDLHLTSLQLERWTSAMQVQFPALTHLSLMLHWLSMERPLAPALPDEFLGGFAPNLQSLELNFIPFPALPKLLLNATQLSSLSLQNIPHSGYISPKVMVTSLAVLVNLKCLFIGFESPESSPNPESRRPPPPSRTLLPALTNFSFQGASEYVEALVAQVDAPLLDYISMSFFHQFTFDTPQLAQFMMRATGLKAFNEAHVDFRDCVWVKFFSQTETIFHTKGSYLTIQCGILELQLSCLAQLFTSFFPSIYTMEHLYIYSRHLEPQPQEDVENLRWLETFQSFTAVKSLYVSKEFVQGIAHSLQELGEERLMDVFPALESLFLEGFQISRPVQEAVEKFVAARQLLGHPVAVSDWDNLNRFSFKLPSLLSAIPD